MKPDFNSRPGIRHSGYAMILMVLALMGVGGVVLAGFTESVKVESEQERYLHNERILREAKQALLQYAYNYPQLGPDKDDGPGRLPCADLDNDGLEEYTISCAGLSKIGRFPWREAGLGFYDARDASGERLWYAVSSDFGRGGSLAINSHSSGGITVEDRSGAILHDGTLGTPGSGVAAVIIAPGAAIDRGADFQDRSIDNGDDPDDLVADTDPGIKDADRYLDLFGTVDNSIFQNGTWKDLLYY